MWLFIVFHQRDAGLPGLAHLFAQGVVAALELVEGKRLNLFGVNPALFIQHLFVGQHVDNLAQHPKPIDGVLAFDHLALEGDRELFHHRCVHPFALVGVETDQPNPNPKSHQLP